MVNRANVYLHLRRESTSRPARLISPGEGRTDVEEADGDRRITRRELANLGNTRGRTVLALISQLLTRDDGSRMFWGLGVVDNACRRLDEWPSREPRVLAKMLTAWSEKQVRNHFHRLYEMELITARQDSANRPWQYEVPETIVDSEAAFRRLPKPEDLQAERCRIQSCSPSVPCESPANRLPNGRG